MLDASDSYGSSWASLSGADFVHQLINNALAEQHKQHKQQPQHVEQPGAPHTRQKQQQQQQQPLAGAHGCSLYTHPQLEQALDNKSLIVDLAPRVRTLAGWLVAGRNNHACFAGCRSFTSTGYGVVFMPACCLWCCLWLLCVPANTRNTQVLYQDEPLVQLLVSCQAHNYLEFKLVEGK